MQLSKNKSKWFMLLLVLGLAFILVAGGCASGENTGEDQGEQSSGGDQQASADEIPMGVLVPYTGEFAAYGTYWFNGAKLAVDEINKVGGPLGKQIRVFTEDTETTVEQGIRAGRKLITANQVIAINGPESNVAVALYDFAKENQVVLASPAAGATKLNDMGGEYQFRTCPSDNFDGEASARMLLDEGFKRIAIVHENDEGRASIADAVEAEFKKLGGEVLTKVAYAPRQTSYLPELKETFKDNPEAVFFAGGQESGPTFVNQWYERNYGGTLMFSADMAIPELFDLVDPAIVEGSLGEIPKAAEDTQQFQRFARLWNEAYGTDAGGAYQSNSYDAQIILALAVEAAGEATGKGIAENYKEVASPPGKVVTSYEEGIKELRAGNDINYEGASGPCDFDEFGNVTGSYSALRVENGKWVEYKFYAAEEFIE